MRHVSNTATVATADSSISATSKQHSREQEEHTTIKVDTQVLKLLRNASDMMGDCPTFAEVLVRGIEVLP